MTQAEINNTLKYALLALAAFSVGCATALVPQLMDPSLPPLNWRIVLGTGITAIITAYGGAFLPRSGSTDIASQVNALKAQGVRRSEMVVLPEEQAAMAVAGSDQVFSPAQVDQLAARLMELRDQHDALISKPPAPPPPPADPALDPYRALGRG